jgi:hypothetical protein
VEYSAHPGSRGQPAFVRRDVAAGSQQVPVGAQNPAFLLPQDDVPVVFVKKRKKGAAVVALDVAPGRWEQGA